MIDSKSKTHDFTNIMDGMPRALARENKEEMRAIASMIKDLTTTCDTFARQMHKVSTSYPLPDVEGKEANLRRSMSLLNNKKRSIETAYEQTCEGIKNMATWLNGACKGIKKFHTSYVSVRHEFSKEKRSIQAQASKWEKTLQRLEDAQAASKRAFQSACRDAERLIQKRDKMRKDAEETGRKKNLNSLESQIGKAIQKCQETQRAYAEKVLKLRKLQRQNFEATSKLMKKLHREEIKRVEESKQMLQKLSRTLFNFLKTASSEMQRVQGVIQKIDQDADAQIFVAQEVAARGARGLQTLSLVQYYPYEGTILKSEGYRESNKSIMTYSVRSEVEDIHDALDVFVNAKSRDVFRRFLEKEMSAENLKYWEAANTLQHMYVDKIFLNINNKELFSAKDIETIRNVENVLFERYLGKDAKEQINIADSLRNKVITRWNSIKEKGEIDVSLLVDASYEVQRMMKRDTIRRFLKTPDYSILAESRKEITRLARNMKQPPPVGIFGNEKKFGYRLRESFLGKSIIKWIQAQASTSDRENAFRIAHTMVAERHIVACGFDAASDSFSEMQCYRICVANDHLRNCPFDSRFVDLSGVTFHSEKEVIRTATRLLTTYRLSMVDLSNSEGLDGRLCTGLLRTIGQIPTVTCIRLSNILLPKPSILELANAIKNCNVKELELRNCGLGREDSKDKGKLSENLKTLITTIKGAKNLRSIDLSQNGLSNVFLQALANALEESENHKLVDCDVSLNSFKGADAQASTEKLRTILEKNRAENGSSPRSPRSPRSGSLKKMASETSVTSGERDAWPELLFSGSSSRMRSESKKKLMKSWNDKDTKTGKGKHRRQLSAPEEDIDRINLPNQQRHSDVRSDSIPPHRRPPSLPLNAQSKRRSTIRNNGSSLNSKPSPPTREKLVTVVGGDPSLILSPISSKARIGTPTGSPIVSSKKLPRWPPLPSTDLKVQKESPIDMISPGRVRRSSRQLESLNHQAKSINIVGGSSRRSLGKSTGGVSSPSHSPRTPAADDIDTDMTNWI